MSFVSEIDNDDVDEPGMDMPGFEGTWNELGRQKLWVVMQLKC